MRSFAIVPAAGRSLRMGQPKLLLPWGSRCLIDAVLDAWTHSHVTRTAVVVRPEDEPLQRLCRAHDVDLVVPSSPPEEMKVSIRLALEHLERTYRPSSSDVWLLAPADMPQLDRAVINALLAEYNSAESTILAPCYRGRRGHPVLFPWRLAEQVQQLGPDEGVNVLLERYPSRQVHWSDPSVLLDVDTPEEYTRQRPTGGDLATGDKSQRGKPEQY